MEVECQTCGNLHRSKDDKCYILCSGCQNNHPIDEMIGGICPQVFPQTKKILQSKYPICFQCDGEGIYEIQTVNIFWESETKYKERIQKFKNEQKEGEEPKRKQIKRVENHKKEKCKKCDGLGLLTQYKFCCFLGCRKCKNKRLIPNQQWKEWKVEKKMIGVKLQNVETCEICHEDMNKEMKIIELECVHHFHMHCINQWFKKKMNCPKCRKEDPYFKVQYDEQVQFVSANEIRRGNRGNRGNRGDRIERGNRIESPVISRRRGSISPPAVQYGSIMRVDNNHHGYRFRNDSPVPSIDSRRRSRSRSINLSRRNPNPRGEILRQESPIMIRASSPSNRGNYYNDVWQSSEEMQMDFY